MIFLFKDERIWERKDEELFLANFAAFEFDVAQRVLTFCTTETDLVFVSQFF